MQENKMGVMKVNKLLISMALPMIFSMLVQALYNIIDSIFVAKLSEDALTAVSLAFPMQNLMIATATGLGVGMNSFLSRSLGEKNFKTANKIAVNGIFLSAIAFLIFFIISFTLIRPYYIAQVGEGIITDMGIEYLAIVTGCSFGIFCQVVFERLLQSTGKTFYAMFPQLTGAIINIILDPIFIFGLLGVPKMGVAGAAIATVIGQICAGILAIILNITKNHEIEIKIKGFRPDKNIIKTILSVGIPSILMASIGSVMTFGMNKILVAFSSTAVAVLGIYFKLQSFVFMPVFGLNNGMVPIISYNYGARKKDRLLKTMKLSIIYAVSIMLVGLFITQTFPDVLLKMFDASEHMLEIGVPALRTISLSFMFAGVCIIIISVFQALGNGIFSMLISITRQLAILLPVAYLLSLTGKLNLVWYAFPIAEIFSVVITLVMFSYIYRKRIKNL